MNLILENLVILVNIVNLVNIVILVNLVTLLILVNLIVLENLLLLVKLVILMMLVAGESSNFVEYGDFDNSGESSAEYLVSHFLDALASLDFTLVSK